MESKNSAQNKSRLENPFWYSEIEFIEQDVNFIKQLLKAPVYKQNIPNLFERLSSYNNQIEKTSKRIAQFISEVAIFRKSLDNYPEEDNPNIDEYYYGRQKHFQDDFKQLDAEFSALKSKIFTYLSGVILK